MNDEFDLDVQRRVHESFDAEVAAWDGSATRRAMAAIKAQPSAVRSRVFGSVVGPVAGVGIVALVVVVVILATQLTAGLGPAGPVTGASASSAHRTSILVSPSPSSTSTLPPTPPPAPTAGPTRTPSSIPTASPSPVITAGDFGRLLLPVPVFAEPDASREPIQFLERGRDLWAPQDPEVIDGALWYRVEFRRLARTSEYMFGWLPGAWEGQAVFRPYQPQCPSDRPIIVSQLTAPELPFCFGDEELQMVGTVERARSSPMIYEVRPQWRASDTFWWICGKQGSAAQGWTFRFHVDPASGLDVPETGMIRVTGHFDDSASRECVRVPTSGYPEPLPGEDEAWCRQQFVVTEIERLTE